MNSGFEKEKKIPIACRYVPYDQWFLTHVPTTWKIKHLKQAILAKSLGLPFDPRRLGHGVAGEAGARPPSPITFAPDESTRPSSPIEFATPGIVLRKKKSTGGTVAGEGKETDCSKDVEEDHEDIYSPAVGGGAGEEGYEEDDERGESDADDGPPSPATPTRPSSIPMGGRVIVPTPPSPGSPRTGKGFNPLLRIAQIAGPSQTFTSVAGPSTSTIPGSSATSTHGQRSDGEDQIYTATHALVRFSTGQILEEDFLLSWYDLGPHELVELHASSPPTEFKLSVHLTRLLLNGGKCMVPLPTSRQSSSLTVDSSLSQAFLGLPSASASSSTMPNQEKLTLSVSSPFHLVSLPRHDPAAYTQPYWEGWVRALRVIWRPDASDAASGTALGSSVFGGGSIITDPAAQASLFSGSSGGTRSMPHYEHSWAGGGLYGGMGAGMAVLVQDPSMGPGGMGMGVFGDVVTDGTAYGSGRERYKDKERDRRREKAKGGDKSEKDRKDGKKGDPRDQKPRGKPSRNLEWRERWVVIKDGMVILCKDREDLTPTHRFPLSSLLSISGPEHLAPKERERKERERQKEERRTPTASRSRPPTASSMTSAAVGSTIHRTRSNTTTAALSVDGGGRRSMTESRDSRSTRRSTSTPRSGGASGSRKGDITPTPARPSRRDPPDPMPTPSVPASTSAVVPEPEFSATIVSTLKVGPPSTPPSSPVIDRPPNLITPLTPTSTVTSPSTSTSMLASSATPATSAGPTTTDLNLTPQQQHLLELEAERNEAARLLRRHQATALREAKILQIQRQQAAAKEEQRKKREAEREAKRAKEREAEFLRNWDDVGFSFGKKKDKDGKGKEREKEKRRKDDRGEGSSKRRDIDVGVSSAPVVGLSRKGKERDKDADRQREHQISIGKTEKEKEKEKGKQGDKEDRDREMERTQGLHSSSASRSKGEIKRDNDRNVSSTNRQPQSQRERPTTSSSLRDRDHDRHRNQHNPSSSHRPTSSSQRPTSSSSRPKDPLRDPSSKSYLPTSREEADAAGMKIVCIKFRTGRLSSGTGAHVEGSTAAEGTRAYRRDEDERRREVEEREKMGRIGGWLGSTGIGGGSGSGKKYTSTGPSLASNQSVATVDIESLKEKGKRKDKERERKKVDRDHENAQRVLRKQPSHIVSFEDGSAQGDGHGGVYGTQPFAPRKASLPGFGLGLLGVGGSNSHSPAASSLNVGIGCGPSGASSTFTGNDSPSVHAHHTASTITGSTKFGIAGLFGNGSKEDKDEKEERKREKARQKEQEREEKRRKKVYGGGGGTSSIGSTKGGGRKGEGATSSFGSIIVGVADDEWTFGSKPRKEKQKPIAVVSSDEDGLEVFSRPLNQEDPHAHQQMTRAHGLQESHSPKQNLRPKLSLVPPSAMGLPLDPTTSVAGSSTTALSSTAGLAGASNIVPLTVTNADSGSDSISPSSPVFARTTRSLSGTESASDADSYFEFEGGYSDLDPTTAAVRRRGYRYGGYQPPLGVKNAGVASTSASHKSKEEAGSMATTYLAPMEAGVGETRRPKETEQEDRGEWIVLDLGSDNAFSSILRIFHRHFPPPIQSTFVPKSYGLASISLEEEDRRGLNHGDGDDDNDDLEDFYATNPQPTPNTRSFTLKSKSSTLTTTTHSTAPAPALPYPEWRTELVSRARREGMREAGRPLDLALHGWGREFEGMSGAFQKIRKKEEEGRRRVRESFLRRGRERRGEGSGVDDVAERKMSLVSGVSTLKPFKESRVKRKDKARAPNLDDDDDDEASGLGYDRDDEFTTSVVEVSDSDSSTSSRNDLTSLGLGIASFLDDSEEESEMEWYAWLTDLPRQVGVAKEDRKMARLEVEKEKRWATEEQDQRKWQLETQKRACEEDVDNAQDDRGSIFTNPFDTGIGMNVAATTATTISANPSSDLPSSPTNPLSPSAPSSTVPLPKVIYPSASSLSLGISTTPSIRTHSPSSPVGSVSTPLSPNETGSLSNYGQQRRVVHLPRSQEEERRLYAEQRRKLEPSAVSVTISVGGGEGRDTGQPISGSPLERSDSVMSGSPSTSQNFGRMPFQVARPASLGVGHGFHRSTSTLASNISDATPNPISGSDSALGLNLERIPSHATTASISSVAGASVSGMRNSMSPTLSASTERGYILGHGHEHQTRAPASSSSTLSTISSSGTANTSLAKALLKKEKKKEKKDKLTTASVLDKLLGSSASVLAQTPVVVHKVPKSSKSREQEQQDSRSKEQAIARTSSYNQYHAQRPSASTSYTSASTSGSASGLLHSGSMSTTPAVSDNVDLYPSQPNLRTTAVAVAGPSSPRLSHEAQSQLRPRDQNIVSLNDDDNLEGYEGRTFEREDHHNRHPQPQTYAKAPPTAVSVSPSTPILATNLASATSNNIKATPFGFGRFQHKLSQPLPTSMAAGSGSQSEQHQYGHRKDISSGASASGVSSGLDSDEEPTRNRLQARSRSAVTPGSGVSKPTKLEKPILTQAQIKEIESETEEWLDHRHHRQEERQAGPIESVSDASGSIGASTAVISRSPPGAVGGSAAPTSSLSPKVVGLASPKQRPKLSLAGLGSGSRSGYNEQDSHIPSQVRSPIQPRSPTSTQYQPRIHMKSPTSPIFSNSSTTGSGLHGMSTSPPPPTTKPQNTARSGSSSAWSNAELGETPLTSSPSVNFKVVSGPMPSSITSSPSSPPSVANAASYPPSGPHSYPKSQQRSRSHHHNHTSSISSNASAASSSITSASASPPTSSGVNMTMARAILRRVRSGSSLKTPMGVHIEDLEQELEMDLDLDGGLDAEFYRGLQRNSEESYRERRSGVDRRRCDDDDDDEEMEEEGEVDEDNVEDQEDEYAHLRRNSESLRHGNPGHNSGNDHAITNTGPSTQANSVTHSRNDSAYSTTSNVTSTSNTTSNSQSSARYVPAYYHQPAPPMPGSPTSSSGHDHIIPSSSAAADPPESQPTPTSGNVGSGINSSPSLRRRKGPMERLVKGLDSAFEFVEGR